MPRVLVTQLNDGEVSGDDGEVLSLFEGETPQEKLQRKHDSHIRSGYEVEWLPDGRLHAWKVTSRRRKDRYFRVVP